jgi:uncharacterized protein (DUF2062 family)
VAWLKRQWRAVLREQATPTRLGLAVGFGVFMGCSPFWTLQTVLALIGSRLFKLNKLAVLLGTQISAPPFAPFLIFASVQLGNRLIRGEWVPLTLDAVKAAPSKWELAKQFIWSFGLGALLVGAILGAIAGWLTYRAVKSRREAQAKSPQFSGEELDLLQDALEPLPAKYRHYGIWKVRMDPVYARVVPLLARCRQVVDLGGGMGLLGALIRPRAPQCQFRVVEWDAEKAQMAAKLLEGWAKVDQADARTVELGSPDAIALLDVLHYLPVPEQTAWLDKCVSALAPGGTLLVRELDLERARFRLSERIEKLAVKRGWNVGSGVHSWPIAQMRSHLEAKGLKVEVEQAGRGMFSANALVLATKPV